GNLQARQITVVSNPPPGNPNAPGTQGAAQNTPAPGPTGPETLGLVVSGFIDRIDPAAGTLTVHTPNADHRIAVGKAPILTGGRKVPVTELQIGDAVSVERALPAGGIDPVLEQIRVVDLDGTGHTRARTAATATGQKRPVASGARPAPAATG